MIIGCLSSVVSLALLSVVNNCFKGHVSPPKLIAGFLPNLSVAGPTMSQLGVFFSSDYLSREPFSLFHHSVLVWLECFSMMIHCNS